MKRRRARHSQLPVALACLAATGAIAQPSLYTMQTEPAHPKESDPFGVVGAHKVAPAVAQQYLLEVTRCVLRRYPQYVPGFLAELPGTPAAHRRAEGLATSECVEGGSLTLNDRLLRGALYEAMYDTSKSRKLSAQSATVPPVDYRPANAACDAVGLADHLSLAAFADCVTRSSPEVVDAVFASQSGSAAEASSFGMLAPSFGGCAAKGAQVKFSKIVLRGLLAESAYRLANASPELASVRN